MRLIVNDLVHPPYFQEVDEEGPRRHPTVSSWWGGCRPTTVLVFTMISPPAATGWHLDQKRFPDDLAANLPVDLIGATPAQHIVDVYLVA